MVGIIGTGGKDGEARGVVEVKARIGEVEVKACTGEVEVKACVGELEARDGVGILFSIICLAGGRPSLAPWLGKISFRMLMPREGLFISSVFSPEAIGEFVIGDAIFSHDL